MNVTVTTYSCVEHLRRIGKLVDGDIDLDILPMPLRRISVVEIQRAVSAQFQLHERYMTSADRAREYARPRQVSMYLCTRLTHRSMPDIGRRHGGRDHSTVYHAVRQISQLRRTEPEIAEAVKILERHLVSGEPTQ